LSIEETAKAVTEKLKASTWDILLGLLKKTPELVALIVVVFFFLQAQEKRDKLLQELVGEIRNMTSEMNKEYVEIHTHLDFLVERHYPLK
jgi:hypothetical protein